MTDKNIYQRINEVMQAVEYVKKDADVQGYKAVSHDMVIAVLRKSMVKAGIVTRVEQLKGHFAEMRDLKADRKMHLYVADYAIHFVNIDKPEDCVSVTMQAHANDTGDKAPGKAASYAVKYALLKTFSLETGENDESRFADPYTKEQKAAYREMIETKKAYELYMFWAALPEDARTGLFNSWPEGHVMANKKSHKSLMDEGEQEFDAMLSDVKERIAAQDTSVTEVTDEMTPVEKRVLVGRLTQFEIARLKKFKEEAE